MALSQQEYEYVKESHQMAIEAQNKSLETFDKHLLFITSGTLVVSLTFIEKIVPLESSGAVWLLITAWSILTISILVNLIGHFIASRYATSYIKQLKKGIIIPLQTYENNNKVINGINLGTFILMFVGIVLIVVYCSINAYNMSKMSSEKPQLSPPEKKGMPFNPPMPPRPTPQPTQPVQPQPKPDTTRR